MYVRLWLRKDSCYDTKMLARIVLLEQATAPHHYCLRDHITVSGAASDRLLHGTLSETA